MWTACKYTGATFNKLFHAIPVFRRPTNFNGKTPQGCGDLPGAKAGRPHPTQAWRNIAFTHTFVESHSKSCIVSIHFD